MTTLPSETEGDEPTAGASEEELRLVAALRQGDEAAFATLIRQYHQSLLRLAMFHVSSHAVAEEVVQETWLGVLQGIDRFEGRSSLRTWIFRILTNRAKRRGEREARTVPFSSLAGAGEDSAEPAVEPERFLPPAHERAPGHWAARPASWDGIPEARLLALETLDLIAETIATLPPAQRQVITMRDVEGWTAPEVCNILQISETNQRVLLHRARSRVRQALERYLSGE